MFEPQRIPEDQCVEGHLDSDPIYDVLLRIHGAKVTGRLTVDDASGPNHLFFMQGRPVGVALAEYVHPLGQLLLELGRVNGQLFVRAQRKIAEGNRLAGQVFKELGVLDDDSLKEVLFIQAKKKAEYFSRMGSRPFKFCRGLTYLQGFTSTPLDLYVVVYIGVRAQLGQDARSAWLDDAREMQVRIKNAAGDDLGLPTAAAAFGFGPPEERFLQRIVGGWERVTDLVETGTLPPEEAAVLLRFLEVIGRLDRRSAPAVPAHISALVKQPREVAALAVPEGFDDVFSSSGPMPAVGAPGGPPPLPVRAAPVPSPDSVFAGPNEATDPRREAIHNQVTQPFGEIPNVEDPLTRRPPGVPPALPFKSVLAPEQSAPPPPSIVVSDDLPPPIVKKKKVKRAEPLPSESSGNKVSETRKEKTQVGPIPTIVIDED